MRNCASAGAGPGQPDPAETPPAIWRSFTTTHPSRIRPSEWIRITPPTRPVVVDYLGNVGIGTASPGSLLHLHGTAGGSAQELIEVDADQGGRTALILHQSHPGLGTDRGPNLQFRMSHGTIASPAALYANDEVMRIDAIGYDGSAYGGTARISANTTQAWTTSAHGTKLVFQTTPNNSTNIGPAMTIDHSGNVGIGTTSPAVALQVGATNGSDSQIFVGATTDPGWTKPAVQVANAGTMGYFTGGEVSLAANVYNDGTDRYATSDYAEMLEIKHGGGAPSSPFGSLAFKSAFSGTAGNAIPWTTTFIVDKNGRVGIGVTNPSHKLTVGSNLSSSGDGIMIDGVLTLAWGGYPPTPSSIGSVVLYTDEYGCLCARHLGGPKQLSCPGTTTGCTK